MVMPPTQPSIVRGRVRHTRHRPITHSLSFATHMWLLDVDGPMPNNLLASFPVKDHFGGGASSFREAISAFAEAKGEHVADTDRLMMLAAARSFGHAFNPLSVFWCLTSEGDVRWLILEIHNTYGSRHAHLVMPDERGRFEIPKEFYVSPFFTIEGGYRVRVHLHDDNLNLGIQLRQDGVVVFSGSFAGKVRPATRRNLALASLRTPLVAHQTTARIRIHGIWLWLRRLPVVPRPTPEIQAGMR